MLYLDKMNKYEQLINLVKSKLGYHLYDHSDDMYNYIYESFQNHYPTLKVEDLMFVKTRILNNRDPLIIFKTIIDSCERLIYCTNDLESCLANCECCCWRDIDRIIINENGITMAPDTDMAEVNIICSQETPVVKSFELYPFEQTFFTLDELGFNEDYLLRITSSSPEYDENLVIKWNDQVYVKVGKDESNNLSYCVYANDKLNCGFVDITYSYQLGDGDTNIYRNENTMIIENCGDVSSVVVIHFSNMVETIGMID